jgi:predicted nucleic acid-binding protein
MINDVFPRANVTGFEHLMDTIILPDPDDIHVLAAAIQSKADLILTYNIKDFPANEMTKFGKAVIHPDDFLSNLIMTLHLRQL